MELYHGSNHIVEKPEYGKGKDNNDYGQGFYLTEIPEKAEDWALLASGDSICNKYYLKIEDLKVCYLDQYGPAAWVAEVLRHRGPGDNFTDDIYLEFCDKYCIDTSIYDVIIGYRADDSYFKIIEYFLRNVITINQVVEYFEKDSLGQQVFLKSQKSFDNISFTGYYNVSSVRLSSVEKADRDIRRVMINKLQYIERQINVGRIKQPIEYTFRDFMQKKNYMYDLAKGEYYE